MSITMLEEAVRERRALGLPRDGTDWESRGGWRMRVRPLGPKQWLRNGEPRRRMQHRLVVQCKVCMCEIPAGRMRQHLGLRAWGTAARRLTSCGKVLF